MVGWCKLLEDTQNKLKIAYSLEEDKSCDGLLIYDKITKEIDIQKKPENRDWMTPFFICPLRCKIDKGLTLGKLQIVMTG